MLTLPSCHAMTSNNVIAQEVNFLFTVLLSWSWDGDPVSLSFVHFLCLDFHWFFFPHCLLLPYPLVFPESSYRFCHVTSLCSVFPVPFIVPVLCLVCLVLLHNPSVWCIIWNLIIIYYCISQGTPQNDEAQFKWKKKTKWKSWENPAKSRILNTCMHHTYTINDNISNF